MKFKQPLTRSAAVRAMVTIIFGSLATAALGFWLFAQDRSELKVEERLREQRAALDGKVTEAQQLIESLSVQIPPEQSRVSQSEKIIRQLEELQSTWDRLVGNRVQQRANDEQLKKMRTVNSTAVARVAELQQQIARARWDLDNYEIERTRIDSQLRVEESRRAGAAYRMRRLWISVRAWLCFGVALYLMGPVLLPIAWEQWRRRKVGVSVGGQEN
jgi:hypothetical protein